MPVQAQVLGVLSDLTVARGSEMTSVEPTAVMRGGLKELLLAWVQDRLLVE